MASGSEPLPFDARVFSSQLFSAPESQGPAVETEQLVACLDLTTLAGDDDAEGVQALCQRAMQYRVAAVCVFPVFVPQAREALHGSGVKVATVAGGFPHGLSPLTSRVHEVAVCRAMHADEIDVVIRRELANYGNWHSLYEEIVAMREAAEGTTLKVILSTGELRDATTIGRTTLCAILAGADFVKTSTGKEEVNATPEAVRAMISAVEFARQNWGRRVGIKVAGGVKTAADAHMYARLATATFGADYIHSDTFRIGASSLLDELIAEKEVPASLMDTGK